MESKGRWENLAREQTGTVTILQVFNSILNILTLYSVSMMFTLGVYFSINTTKLVVYREYT